MNQPPAELSARRRAVYQALAGRVPPSAVARAVKLCDDEFAACAMFPVAKFLSRLGQSEPAVAAANTDLYREITKLRGQTPAALGPDPLDVSAVTPAPRVAASGGWAGVFNALADELMATVRHADPDRPHRLRSYLSSGELRLGSAGSAELREWLATGWPAFTDRTPRAELHAVVHAAYVWACEDVGPVAADRLFARAVQAAERHPDAVRFPPRALL